MKGRYGDPPRKVGGPGFPTRPAKVTVELPVRPTSSSETSSRHILVVDDDEDLVSLLEDCLTHFDKGFRVETASSGEEALSRMAVQSFALVITDLQMSGMSGLALMEQIRERYPHTQLVLITGNTSAQIESFAYQLGACKKLTKPFCMQELLSTVQMALA